MAKRKQTIDLSSQNITYETEKGRVKVIRFNPNSKSVDINLYIEGEKVRTLAIAFAHLPKHVKKLLKPL